MTALAKIAAFQNSPVDKLCHCFSVNQSLKQGAPKNGFPIERFTPAPQNKVFKF